MDRDSPEHVDLMRLFAETGDEAMRAIDDLRTRPLFLDSGDGFDRAAHGSPCIVGQPHLPTCRCVNIREARLRRGQ